MRKILYSALLFILTNYGIAQPPQFNVTVYTPESEGYYFLCPYRISAFPNFPPGNQNQMILDDKGNVIYYKPFSGYFAGDFKLQPNGQMSYAGNNKFFIMDSTFTIVDSVWIQGAGYRNDLHDLQILNNGHYLLMGNENLTMDLSNHFVFMGNNSPGSANATLVSCIIQELDENKNVVFEWHAIDHYNIDDVDEFFMGDSTFVDWTHVNAVEMDDDGNIMISLRHFSEVTKISRADSSIIWRMGGKANQFNFLNDSNMFLSQHDIRRNDDGTISIFDNGRDNVPVHKASAKIYSIDEVNKELTIVRSHSEGPSVWSRSQGNAQVLPDGKLLISYGDLSPDRIVFNVVDSSDNKIFEIMFPDSQITYRSYNFETLPWSLNQPTLHCFNDSSGAFYIGTDSSFSSYLWSNGDTTSTVPVTGMDTIYVFVPRGDGGFIRSENYVVIDSLDPCGTNGISAISDQETFSVFPNPATGMINVRFSKKLNTEVRVYDLTGRMVLSEKAKSEIMTMDLSALGSGIYMIRCGSVTKKILVQDN